jgi:FkbM family methyltransferase
MPSIGRVLGNVALGLIVLCPVVGLWPKARLAVVWASGRSQGCSFEDTVNSHELLLKMQKLAQDIGAASHPVQEDPSGLELMDTPRGRIWTIRNDRFLRYTLAEQQLEIYGTNSGVQPGDVVLDGGANVGVFTRTALTRGASLVVSIEPTPLSVEALRRNFAPEIAAGRVIVYPEGIWDHVDTLELAEAGEGNTAGNSFVFGRSLATKVKVPLTTIDLLAADLHLPRVDFIKMDIEGAEKQALRGATETIRKYHPRMAIATEHLAEDPREIPKVVRAIWPGYRNQPSTCMDAFSTAPPEVMLFTPR